MFRCYWLSFPVVMLLAGALLPVEVVTATGPGWSPNIIATGPQREHLRSLPIEQRPNRPLHFYGNTVRRLHHQGTVLPRLDEFSGRGPAAPQPPLRRFPAYR